MGLLLKELDDIGRRRVVRVRGGDMRAFSLTIREERGTSGLLRVERTKGGDKTQLTSRSVEEETAKERMPRAVATARKGDVALKEVRSMVWGKMGGGETERKGLSRSGMKAEKMVVGSTES